MPNRNYNQAPKFDLAYQCYMTSKPSIDKRLTPCNEPHDWRPFPFSPPRQQQQQQQKYHALRSALQRVSNGFQLSHQHSGGERGKKENTRAAAGAAANQKKWRLFLLAYFAFISVISAHLLRLS
jgi:hypothetical protein